MIPNDMVVGTVHSSRFYGDVIVIEYINSKNVLVEFINTGSRVYKYATRIREGNIKDPTLDSTMIIRERENKLGKIFSSNNYGDFKIIGYMDRDNVKIKFVNTGHEKNTRMINILSGDIKDPYYPSIFGIGYLGEGVSPSEGGKGNKLYITWFNMVQRCYSDKYHQKKPTYKDCTVCEEWHNFQNFAKWMQEKIDSGEYQDGYHLDKDKLQPNISNKVYSPDTCVFISAKENSEIRNGKV